MALLASSYDQSRYLRAEDVRQDRLLRIKGATEETVGQGADQEKKLVVWFTNDQRGLVLNRTNNRTIRGAYGDDTSGWAGQLIVVFQTPADYRGRMVPALRVRIPPPKQQPNTVPQQPTAPQPAVPASVQPQAVAAAPTAAVAQQPSAAAPAAAAPMSAPRPMQAAVADPAAASFDLDDEIPWVP
jgi:hypothetical protein